MKCDVEWWLFRGDGVNTSKKGPAVLMAHGNRELIDFFRNRAEAYQRMGYTVVPAKHALKMKEKIPGAKLILYPCGHSDGPPDWDMYWNDIAGFLDEAQITVRRRD